MFTPEHIYQLVAERRIPSQAWLAQQLKMSSQAFNKMLLHGKGFGDDVQRKLNDILKREGIITDSTEQCSLLIKQTLHTDSIINQSLSSLNEITIKLAGDDDLSFDDKKKLIANYESMLDQVQERIYDLIRIVKGKK